MNLPPPPDDLQSLAAQHRLEEVPPASGCTWSPPPRASDCPSPSSPMCTSRAAS
ncbi:MAG: hypothetical protein R3F43_14340 [bacterium]